MIFDRLYAEGIQRPFGVRYNPYTQSVEVLSSAKRITAVVSELRGDLSIVSSALRKVSALDHNLDVEKITQMLQAGLQVFSNAILMQHIFGVVASFQTMIIAFIIIIIIQ